MEVPDFDAVYRADTDPWGVRSSAYEGRKLEIVLACLSRPTYTTAWDPACGVGELAARLAARTDRVLATDGSVEATQLTRTRTIDLVGVQVGHQALPAPPPADWPGFDLVVLSEFFYYLSADERVDSMAMIGSVLADQAEILSLHWRHKPHDAWLSGADTQAEIVAWLTRDGWQPVVHHEDRDFVLDSFERLR